MIIDFHLSVLEGARRRTHFLEEWSRTQPGLSLRSGAVCVCVCGGSLRLHGHICLQSRARVTFDLRPVRQEDDISPAWIFSQSVDRFLMLDTRI